MDVVPAEMTSNAGASFLVVRFENYGAAGRCAMFTFAAHVRWRRLRMEAPTKRATDQAIEHEIKNVSQFVRSDVSQVSPR